MKEPFPVVLCVNIRMWKLLNELLLNDMRETFNERNDLNSGMRYQ